MAYTIIHRKDKEKLADMMSEMLSIGGRMMSCIEEMEEADGYGERRSMGMRDGGRYGNRYGDRYGMREHGWDGYDPYDMGERRYRRY